MKEDFGKGGRSGSGHRSPAQVTCGSAHCLACAQSKSMLLGTPALSFCTSKTTILGVME